MFLSILSLLYTELWCHVAFHFSCKMIFRVLIKDLSPDPRSQEGSRVAELEKRLQILEQELCALKRAVDFGSTRG